jgi:curved DNA-binding protein CbpA
MHNEQYKQFDCYKVLGISSKATPDEIKTAYRTSSRLSHPDKGGTHEAQVKVNTAYEILSDPISRQAHDTYWYSTTGSSTPRVQYSHPYSPPKATSRPSTTPFQSEDNKQKPFIKEPLIGLRNRILEEIDKKKDLIWHDLDKRAINIENTVLKKLSEKKQEARIIIIIGVILAFIILVSQYPILWLIELYLGWLLVKRLSAEQVGISSFTILDLSLGNNLHQAAQLLAKETCENEVNALNNHFSSLASLSELLLRSSTYDDSEEQVARRLAASFFIMGYYPINFDREDRALLFNDGENNILVRYRHRSGIATNIAYVEKLTFLMSFYKANRGFLFCSPGLSGNAAIYADTHSIKWYSIETMNNWIEQVLVSDYSGPKGDILVLLDKLNSFLGTISPVITARSRKYHFRTDWFR